MLLQIAKFYHIKGYCIYIHVYIFLLYIFIYIFYILYIFYIYIFIVYIYYVFFIHLSVNGHLGHFQVLAMVNNASVKIAVHPSF